MSQASSDKYEHYNYDENIMHSRGSGKHRTKSEAEQNKNIEKGGPGHTRKIVNNMRNNDANNREAEHTGPKH